MLKPYRTILKQGQDEVIIQRSRFIGYSKPVQTEAQALKFIEEIRKQHWNATHNVWAYILGVDNSIQRYSDDGEPQGTAGIPTLEVIKKAGMVNVAVVATRYFGGTKLGAGGLVRAYTQTAKIALAAGTPIFKEPYITRYIQTEYNLIGKFQHELENNNYIIKNIIYTDKVTFQVQAPQNQASNLETLVLEMTAGQGYTQLGEDVYIDKEVIND